MKPLKIAAVTLGLALAGAALILMVYAILFLRDARKGLEKLFLDMASVTENVSTATKTLEAVQTDTTRTEAEMAGLLNATRHSLMTPAQTKELVDRAANLLDNANLSVIRVGAAAQSLQGIAPTTQAAIAQLAQDSHDSLAQSQALLKAGTDDLQDPAIKKATQATEESAENVDATTRDFAAWVHRETAPVRGTWNVLKEILFEIAGPAASVASAVK